MGNNMKKMINTSYIYLLLALVAGVFSESSQSLTDSLVKQY